jgi:putative ABC transport system permease protein
MSTPPRFNFFKLVARNLKNRPYRNIPTIFVFAIIAATLFSAQYLVIGTEQDLDKSTRTMGADLMVVPEEHTEAGENTLLTGKPTTFFFSDSGYEKISRVPGVARASPQIYIATLSASCCDAPIQIIAVDPGRDFTISPWLQENPGVKLGKDDIIIGSGIEGEVGSNLMFYGHLFHVAGRLEETGMMGVDMTVFTRIEDAYTMAEESRVNAVEELVIPRGMVSSVLVKVNPGASVADVGGEIQRQVPHSRIITPTGLLGTVTAHLAGITRILYSSMLAVTAISILLIGFISVMVARELRREITLLGALGVTKAFIIQLVLAESFSLSLIGGVCGIAAAAVFLVSFQNLIALTLRIPFSIPSPAALLVAGGSALLVCLIIGGIASIYPTIRVVRSEAYKTIPAKMS